MFKYFMKRLVFLILTFLIITYLLYALLCLVPGNPLMYRMPDEYSSEERPSEAKAALGIITVNYAKWMGFWPDERGKLNGLLQGNLGSSAATPRSVAEIVSIPFANTMFLNTASTLLTMAITIPLGIYCAVHYKSRTDAAIQTLTLVGSSVPLFLIALLAIFIFAVVLKIFPATGMQTPGARLHGAALMVDRLHHLALPILCLTFAGMANLTRTVRAAMVDTLTQDYIRTARAKGLREKIVVYSHAWRNALLPVSTALGDWIIAIFSGGSLIIETSFALVGTGSLFWNSLKSVDFEIVLCLQVIYILALLVGRLIVDFTYVLTDPRIKIEK